MVMPLHNEVSAEHVKFWSMLSNRIVHAVVQKEPHIIEVGLLDHGINFTEDNGKDALSVLSEYFEVDRMTIESFYHPEDSTEIQKHAEQLIIWTQSARKELMEIQREIMELQKEQEQYEDDRIFPFEHRIRAILSLTSSLRQQVAAASSQETKTAVEEKSFSDSTILVQPQSLCHNVDIGLEPAQIGSHIAKISNGLMDLGNARHSYESQLGHLETEIKNEYNLSPPLKIRPIGTTPEDIRIATRSIAEYNAKLIIKCELDDLSNGIEQGHRGLAKKLYKDLEIPFRTIQLQMKQLKINTADILQDF